MNRVWENILCVLMRERPLERMEKEVTKGTGLTFDVFLKKGIEYMVRGKIPKGRGVAKVSLGNADGLTTPVYGDRSGAVFTVTPEEDGFYHIWATVQPKAGNGRPVTFRVTLCRVLASPPYVVRQSALPSYLVDKPEPKGGPAERNIDPEMMVGEEYASVETR
jgi:hypothetical protein